MSDLEQTAIERLKTAKMSDTDDDRMVTWESLLKEEL